MNKNELLSLAERVKHPRNDFQLQDDLLTVGAILRNLAALEPVAMVRVGLSATEIRFINQPRESAHLYNLTGIIDHE